MAQLSCGNKDGSFITNKYPEYHSIVSESKNVFVKNALGFGASRATSVLHDPFIGACEKAVSENAQSNISPALKQAAFEARVYGVIVKLIRLVRYDAYVVLGPRIDFKRAGKLTAESRDLHSLTGTQAANVDSR